MEKYNIKNINDYIKGEKVEGYSIEELENDKEFMMLVIKKTNDKNFYKLCSEGVKKDYEFVKYLITKFKDDIEYICEVADFYLKDLDDEITRIELIIIMTELTKNNKEKNHNYKIILESIFKLKRVKIEMGKIEQGEEYSREVGMGFIVIFDQYNKNKTILEFYAKRIIEEIFVEYDIDLEKILYNRFKTPEELDKMGINNYIIEFVSYYDPMLSSYLSTNIELMTELKTKIEEIQKKWNLNIKNKEIKKYTILYEKVHEYITNYGSDSILDETTIMYYVAKQLGITKQLMKYDRMPIKYEIDEEFIIDTLRDSFEDNILVRNVRKIMEEIIFSDSIPEEKTIKCKIIKINKDKRD